MASELILTINHPLLKLVTVAEVHIPHVMEMDLSDRKIQDNIIQAIRGMVKRAENRAKAEAGLVEKMRKTS